MEAQELLKMKQGDLGDYMGYSKSFVSAVANGHLEPSKTLILLLETLIKNHRLTQELTRVRGAAAELMGAAISYPRHTEGPSTLVGTASLGAREPKRQTPAEIFETAKQKVLSQIPQAAVPSVPKPKPVREKKPPASCAPPAKDAQP